MRFPGLLVATLAFPLAFAGCIDAGSGSGLQAADAGTEGAAGSATVDSSEPLELGAMGFVLGPAGNTPVTATRAVLSGIEVPDNVQSVVVQLALAEGVTVELSATGLPGCEQRVDLPSHVGGYARATSCEVAPGTYDLVVAHTTGHVEGTVVVLATYV